MAAVCYIGNKQNIDGFSQSEISKYDQKKSDDCGSSDFGNENVFYSGYSNAVISFSIDCNSICNCSILRSIFRPIDRNFSISIVVCSFSKRLSISVIVNSISVSNQLNNIVSEQFRFRQYRIGNEIDCQQQNIFYFVIDNRFHF